MAGTTTDRRGARSSPPSGPPLLRIRLRRPRRRTLVASLAGAVLLGVGAVWVLYGSDWTRVERVNAEGTTVLRPRQVVAAAGVPAGDPLVSVDTDEVAARLRAALPRIAEVDVVRSWPDNIDLKVTERRPQLLIEAGGRFTEVDAEGVRFAQVRKRPDGVPLLELAAGDSPSRRRFGADRLRREAVRVAAGLPAEVRRDTRVVKVGSYDSITLELTDGRTVRWGSGENGRAKSRTLLALLKAARGARHFDVSAPTAPAASGS
ncbi:cell division protein FtsQ/DivIB [Streptomyces sp. NPDC001922]|uniref:cell division protein FtsQ/DivIB n=1 Tax=Streptomyces sp. NPDC001922 TaxID=3364624 RepID=UPI0036C42434